MDDSKTNLVFVKTLGRLLFYAILSLGLFFTVAIVIFEIRSRNPDQLVMQDLVGKYYVDVHNDLSRSRFHIKIDRRKFSDRPPGIILAQSLPPGSLVPAGEQLTVTVNQPDPIVPMPDLVGTSLEAARSTLSRITYQEDIYALEIGAVTEFATNDVPPDTVLMQFPPAGENTLIDDKVYLLVSRRVDDGTGGQPATPGTVPAPGKTTLDEKSLVGQNITVVNELLRRSKIDYRIHDTKKPPLTSRAGIIYGASRRGDGTLDLDVYYREPSKRFQSGYEFLSFELDEPGNCAVELDPMEASSHESESDESEKPRKRSVFQTERHGEDEEVRILFYRTGAERLMARCGGKEVYSKKLKPDNLS